MEEEDQLQPQLYRIVSNLLNILDRLSINSTLSDIKKKFAQVVQSFPFYGYNIQKIKQVSSCFQGTFEEYIETLQDLDKLTKHLLKEVISIAESKLRVVFPSNKFEEVTLQIFLLFMAKGHKPEIQNEKKNVIGLLIRNTQVNSKYSSGRFSFLIINFVNFICHILLYFPLMITLFQHFDQLNKVQIEKLIISKTEVNGIKYDELKQYFENKLEKINPKIKPDSIMNSCLPYIFEPIKYRMVIIKII